MKSIRQKHHTTESLEFFDSVGREPGYRIGDQVDSDRFLEDIKSALTEAASDPIVIHGHRTEAMFMHVATSLGGCKLIRTEDAGEVYADDASLRVPDFRVVTKSGDQFFVEVKNCYNRLPKERIRLRGDYIAALERYADVFGSSVRIAVFWAHLQQWMLVSSQHLPTGDGGRRDFNLLEGFPINEMATLGDFSVGIKPPLSMHVLADPTKPLSEIDGEGRRVRFTIGALEFHCGGDRIHDELESTVAHYLMLNAPWQLSKDEVAKLGEHGLPGVVVTKEPWGTLEDDRTLPFSMAGSLSTMISNAYANATATENGVYRLTPKVNQQVPAALLDPDYEGEVLQIVRMTQQPNYDLLAKGRSDT